MIVVKQGFLEDIGIDISQKASETKKNKEKDNKELDVIVVMQGSLEIIGINISQKASETKENEEKNNKQIREKVQLKNKVDSRETDIQQY